MTKYPAFLTLQTKGSFHLGKLGKWEDFKIKKKFGVSFHLGKLGKSEDSFLY